MGMVDALPPLEHLPSGLRQLRRQRGWTQAQLIDHLRAAAAQDGVRLPPARSLRIMVSRWENGHVQPEKDYRHYLRQVLSQTSHPAQTDSCSIPTPGHAPVPLGGQPPGWGPTTLTPELVAHYTSMLSQQVAADVRWGSGVVAGAAASLALTLQRALSTSSQTPSRPCLELAFHAIEFYGWVLQDAGELQQAQAWTDRALSLSDPLEDPFRRCYALMRKSSIASDAGHHDLARHLSEQALHRDISSAPRLKAVVLRQQAIAYAGVNRPLLAMRSLDRACETVAACAQSAAEEELICLYCTPSYIASEAGAAWLQLGYPDRAVGLLQDAVVTWASPDRDQVYLFSRLARAHALVGDVDSAQRVAQLATQAAAEVFSPRVNADVQMAMAALRRREAPVFA